jgi:hypothetical protein
MMQDLRSELDDDQHWLEDRDRIGGRSRHHHGNRWYGWKVISCWLLAGLALGFLAVLLLPPGHWSGLLGIVALLIALPISSLNATRRENWPER